MTEQELQDIRREYEYHETVIRLLDIGGIRMTPQQKLDKISTLLVMHIGNKADLVKEIQKIIR